MSLTQFAQEYSQLSSTEQAQFAETVRRLLADGLIWREDEEDRRSYSFLLRRRELVADYLAVGGWELRHEERVGAFHVVHRDGAHRRRLNREATVWLLLLRLIYAEKRERLEVGLTRYPVVEVGEVARRYAEFFPGQNVRKRSSLSDALRSFQALKLVRAAGGGGIRAGNVEQLIELLPTLEIVVPPAGIAALAERLRAYDRTGAREDGETHDEE
ncbi:MAG TPA: DUF4194 domain-containing protein [Roseiflexaceae bacterium]|nr:DUF4194 domain-containing protein [Roseiflexaceae bacterium]